MPETLPAQEQSAQPDQHQPTAFENVAVDNLIAKLTGQAPDQAQFESNLSQALAPVVEETPAETVESKEQQPPAEGDPETAEPEKTAEEESAEEADVSDRIRLTKYTDPDRAKANAVHLLVKAGMSYDEAARRVIGDMTSPKEQEAPADPEVPAQITSLEAEVADLETQLDTLANEADEGVFRKEIVSLQKTLAQKQAQLAVERYANQQNRAVKSEVDDAVFMTELKKVEASVPREFPDMKNRTSPQYRMAVALGKEIAENPNHPLHRRMLEVDAPYVLAEEAAKTLEQAGLKVNRTSKPVAPSTPQSPRVASSPANTPKPGPAPGSKTSAPAPTVTAEAVVADARNRLASVLGGGQSKSNVRLDGRGNPYVIM